MPGKPPRDPDAAFDAWVDRRGPDECWPWTGPTDARSGYGIFNVADRGPLGAHVYAWERDSGCQRPWGYHVHHRCRTRGCVNPAHLDLLSPLAHAQVHAQDRREAVHRARGEAPPPPATLPVDTSCTGYEQAGEPAPPPARAKRADP